VVIVYDYACDVPSVVQWAFRKMGTMGTLGSRTVDLVGAL